MSSRLDPGRAQRGRQLPANVRGRGRARSARGGSWLRLWGAALRPAPRRLCGGGGLGGSALCLRPRPPSARRRLAGCEIVPLRPPPAAAPRKRRRGAAAWGASPQNRNILRNCPPGGSGPRGSVLGAARLPCADTRLGQVAQNTIFCAVSRAPSSFLSNGLVCKGRAPPAAPAALPSWVGQQSFTASSGKRYLSPASLFSHNFLNCV